MKKILLLLQVFLSTTLFAQKWQTVFEKTSGKETVTYEQCISYYKELDAAFNSIRIREFGMTDAGYPLHLILFSTDGKHDPIQWHKDNKVVIMINNGIHPGEPDGIDASMMLLRDLVTGKIKAPENVVLGIIPIYNIGGSLNRTAFSRVNQEGPLSYGFRGNAQNLDLNRDFIKSDSREAKEFARVFQFLNPDILVDNHVSDGADYQHTMTLLTSQHNKLGSVLGQYLHDVFEPSLYKGMEEKKWPLVPYVSFEGGNPERNWVAFYDPPRYSSGYATLFQTMAFMPETHMLKPFEQRVKSTYSLMQTFLEEATKQAAAIKSTRKKAIEAVRQQQEFPLTYRVDTSRFDMIRFLGYESGQKTSEVTGMKRTYYDRSKPYTKNIKYFNYFVGEQLVTKPKAYIIPQGWHEVIERLALNSVIMQRLKNDTVIEVEVSRLSDYRTATRAFEKHYRQSGIKMITQIQKIKFLKGDYMIYTGQAADRFLIETLEPGADDSYFSWNFFDAILQQKEGYSNYRWEDVAAKYLTEHPEVRAELEARKKADEKFAANANAQLDFVYRQSPYYEPAHMRYPVFKLR
ncbi:M14 family metallopeptidase [Sediminibacterium goheungense]|uniref:Zinc carboxypeptidase n=1 Tax=Sediminibacterium goheungense TaxID=1086393 RepID=A0A4R6J2T4_9BACT|nr:M14 family metallopeptidase [Sediminibacterium goheungense]TDO28485.1 zinc carboxypeptidase [Sediminibacterium goheungense]